MKDHPDLSSNESNELLVQKSVSSIKNVHFPFYFINYNTNTTIPPLATACGSINMLWIWFLSFSQIFSAIAQEKHTEPLIKTKYLYTHVITITSTLIIQVGVNNHVTLQYLIGVEGDIRKTQGG